MRALLIADIHANLAALRALPPADVVFCAGDLVTYGPEPAGVIEETERRGVLCVRGDEAHAVAENVAHVVPPGTERAAEETRSWTRSVLRKHHLAFLRALPPELEFEVSGLRVAVVHAYPGDYERYLEPNPEELLRVKRAFPRARLIVLGHTHRRGIWHVGSTTIVNPGSVGQPSVAGRASFALLVDGSVSFGEASFPLEDTIAELRRLPLTRCAIEECVEVLQFGTTRPAGRLPLRPRKLSHERCCRSASNYRD